MKVSNAIASLLIFVFFLAWMTASYQNYAANNPQMAFDIAAFIVSCVKTLMIILVAPTPGNVALDIILISTGWILKSNESHISNYANRIFKR